MLANNQQTYGWESTPQEEHILSVEVQKYVNDVRFPANRDDLVEHAVEHHAPNRVIDVLQQLPNGDFGYNGAPKSILYRNVNEVIQSIEQVG